MQATISDHPTHLVCTIKDAPPPAGFYKLDPSLFGFEKRVSTNPAGVLLQITSNHTEGREQCCNKTCCGTRIPPSPGQLLVGADHPRGPLSCCTAYRES
jgi:hypothetical protein